jgi:hypothetical protein
MDDSTKAAALFRGTPDYRRHRGPTKEHTHQSGCYRASISVVIELALYDFFVDWIQSQTPAAPDTSGSWTMYFDGSKRSMGASAGVVLISPHGDKMKYVLRMNFPLPTNNEAEYEALLHGMRMAKACGTTRLEIYGDSNLVVQQSMNLCDTVSDNMIAY